NPGLVYCSISAYGQKSKRRGEPAHDLNLQAESGLLLAGLADGEVPRISGLLAADYASALTASTAIMGALYQRDFSGSGQHLDISMLQCAAQLLGYQATSELYTGLSPKEGGFDFPRVQANYSVYRCCDDKYLAVACIEPQYWGNFCEIVGLPEEKSKTPRFEADGTAVYEKVQKLLAKKSREDWLELFAGKKCCVSPVHTVSDALVDKDIANRALVSLKHTKLGAVKQLKAFTLKRDDGGKTQHLDGNTDPTDILKRFGISKKLSRRLIETGALSRSM
ncbi:MAG: CoA transferase, partial [Cyanobacteria bacterium]|nr:CoA transferase [Cyanobacteriota bacterium]